MAAHWLDEGELERLQRRWAWPTTPRRRRTHADTRDARMTLDELAAELGMSRQAVHQIEQKALEKCRRWCRARGLRLEDVLG
ncbi:MAG: hypothetical protein K9L70_12385 [Thiohalocapsa sp.]|nr:hypothetical protein [Thiohalocapsa sp.]MCF7992236.1 hypothetical protein [Thiohalocapsa sp.]